MRQTFLTRFGEAGAEPLTIKKIAGHSSVIVAERYVNTTPKGQERAFENWKTSTMKRRRVNCGSHRMKSDGGRLRQSKSH
jgi:hypothetical protein